MSAGKSAAARATVKRAADFTGAAIILLFSLPIFALAALAIRLFMGRPVLFRQTRPGLGAQSFTVYKLRTMTEDFEGAPPEFARVTPLGRFLRRTNIDELPQLWNVLRGEMSLVGPRPLLMQYLEHYDAVQRRRHEVRPGITGWAQVHRRKARTWNERLDLDVWYVDHWTLRLDAVILVMTIRELFSVRGDPSMESLSRTRDEELAFRGSSGPSATPMRPAKR